MIASTKRESRLVLTGKWSQPLERFRRALRVTRTLRGSDLEAQDKTYAAEPYEKKKNSCDIIQNRPLCERRTVSRGNPRTTNTTRGANRTVREISHRRVNIKAVNNKSRGVFQNNGYIELYFQNFGVRPSEITPSKYEGKFSLHSITRDVLNLTGPNLQDYRKPSDTPNQWSSFSAAVKNLSTTTLLILRILIRRTSHEN